MQNNLVMTSSPHLRDHSSTQRIMQEVCLALLPAGIAGVIIFGWSWWAPCRTLAVLQTRPSWC